MRSSILLWLACAVLAGSAWGLAWRSVVPDPGGAVTLGAIAVLLLCGVAWSFWDERGRKPQPAPRAQPVAPAPEQSRIRRWAGEARLTLFAYVLFALALPFAFAWAYGISWLVMLIPEAVAIPLIVSWLVMGAGGLAGKLFLFLQRRFARPAS